MLIIEQIEKVYGIKLSDYQKNLISKLLNIPSNAKIRYGRDGRMEYYGERDYTCTDIFNLDEYLILS